MGQFGSLASKNDQKVKRRLTKEGYKQRKKRIWPKQKQHFQPIIKQEHIDEEIKSKIGQQSKSVENSSS